MEIITTHVGADFDGFGAMLAARRLHPQARLFFPGSREESLRRMLDSGLMQVQELRRKEIDPAQLERVILVDIRQPERLGVVAEWLASASGIEVLAYDHHPDSPTDLAVDGGLVDPEVGSTSTLMVEELGRRGIAPSVEEATALLLGIYEDTGALSYATTSPRDLEAAAELLRRGAELAHVRRFAQRSLDARRLEILHRMTQALAVHRLRGHRVGIVALELGEYLDELAPLVSRCLEIFELPVLFALFGEAERVTIIARGEIPDLDLGRALAEFAAGGGHPTAAAASVRGATAIEVRERLLSFLAQSLPPAATAADLMIRNFYEIEAQTSVSAAKDQLNRAKINAAPVTIGGQVRGAVTRQTLDAALQHGLGERPVETVMITDLTWVPPEAAPEEIGQALVVHHPRFVLVGDPVTGKPLGLVTRMAVLRHLHGRLEAATDPLDRRSREQRGRRRQVARLLAERLPVAVRACLEAVARVSRSHGVPVYLVGGLVRDLLLERENSDIDLVVEGDGLHFARLLAAEVGGRVREHEVFMTAVVVDGEGRHLDIATARSEFYRAPAALPEVQTSALRQDLYRRDFTINALAIRLGPEKPPELIDYFGGWRDLEGRTLRVLHSLSFIDDPTRILRAVRLELRLGFRISAETLRLVTVALEEGIFQRLSGSRLREELTLLLDDPDIAVQGLARLEELGLLTVLHPRLAMTEALRERLRGVTAVEHWHRLEQLRDPAVVRWRLVLLALAQDLTATERGELADRLALAGENRRLLLSASAEVERVRTVLRRPECRPHQASEALAPLVGEELLLLMANEEEPIRAWVRRELTEFRRLRLQVRGADLLAAGFPAGPEIGAALRATRAARLDGAIEAGEELEYALAALAGRPAATGDPSTRTAEKA